MKRIVLSVCAAVAAAVMAQAETYTWTGGTGTWDANSGAKWTNSTGGTGTVPGAKDDVIIPAPASGTVTVTYKGAITVNSLEIGGTSGGTAVLSSETLEAFQVTGSCTILTNGKVTHKAGDTTEPYKVVLMVGGDLTITEGGKVDVSGCGGSGAGRSNDNPYGYEVAAHGGEAADHRLNTRLCYGSVRYPFNYGSQGGYANGGGAAMLSVAGALRVDGSILAEPSTNSSRNGSGGSVWIEAGELLGGGVISAQALATGQGCGGGGRIAVKLTNAGADFSAPVWTGTITACGSLPLSSAAGTVYEQTGDQQDGFGTLYIDNGGLANTAGYTEFNGRVTDTDVGDVVIRGGARFRIWDDGALTVRGSIINEGTFVCKAGGSVTLDSAQDCLLKGGTFSISRLYCKVPGKTVKIADGTSLAIQNGGSLVLNGSATSPLTVIPENGASNWSLTLGSGVEQDVQYVAVKNAQASADIADFGGTDLTGNNDKWTFPAPVTPGATVTWTGATDTDWFKAGNWSPNRVPVKTDVAQISLAANGVYPICTQGKFTVNAIVVDSGATLTFAGTLPTVTNRLEVSGTLVAKGSQEIVCLGDVDFKPGATVEAPSATLRLTGPRARTLSFGDQSVYKVVAEADCGDITFATDFAATIFRNLPGAAARTLSFGPGTTCATAGFIADGGAAGLTLASTAAGQTWTLSPKCFLYVNNATATDCGRTLEDSGFVWKGGTGNFNAASGWSGNAVPGGDDCAFIPSGTVTLNDERTVGTVVVGGFGSSAAFKVPVEANAKHHLMLLEGATATCDKHFTIGGDVLVDSGATVTHQSGDKTEPYKVDFDVAGSMTVAAGGSIDVSAKGNNGSGYTTGNSGVGTGGYGGEPYNNRSRVCYGSVRQPFNYGSNGQTGPSGGAAKLVVAGELAVYGQILSWPVDNQRNGSGGSIWLTAGTLRGSGTVSANARKGTGDQQFCGAGGRVAVKLTEPGATFAAWTGKITAYGAKYNGNYYASCGTVYEQTGDQQDGYGTLYVDGGSLATLAYQYGYVDFNDKVTDSDVGDVVIRGNGRLRISAGGVLTVRGSITIDPSHGIFTSEPGGELVLDSANDCVVSGGTLTLSTLRCNAAGKTVRMATGSALKILDGGTLNLTGAKAEPLTLVPVEAASTWNLTLGAGVVQSVEYVAVSNSVANVDVTDVGGTDLGGNSEQWTFIKPIEPGTAITWTGAAGTSDWTAKGNWDLGRAPADTDVAVINVAQGGNYPVLEMGEFSINTIQVKENASLTFAGALPTVTNRLEVTGTLVVKERQKIFCRGDLVFKPGATYVSEGSAATFVLTGAGTKHVTLNGQRLHSVLIEADAGDVAFMDSAAVRLLRNVPGAAARTIALAANSTLTVDGLVADGGAAGLTLPGESWHLATKYFAYVKNATASGCDRPLETSGFVWNGGTADFGTASNWGGTVPGADDCAFIPSGTVTVGGAGRTVGTLVVGGQGSSAAVTVSAPLTVADDFCLADGATVTSDKPVTVGGDLVIYDGATVKQSAGTYMEYAVAGQAEVCYAGQIDGRGAGNVTTGRGASGNQTVACYGGLGVYNTGIVTAWKCYGSIANPTNLGTAGNYNNGGGRLRLVTTGELRVDGTISCNPVLYSDTADRAGSGGSVWITCAKLTGTGRIEADGEDGQFGEGGGRLAIEQKSAADFSAFKGVAEARDRSSRGGAGTVCLTGAGTNPQVVIADVLTGDSKVLTYTQIPGYTDADKPKQLKKMGFVVKDGARVRLMADMTIRDLDLQTKNVELDLNGHTLTIRSTDHKNGRGWAEGATVSTTGQIVWKPAGFVISVR